MTTSVFARFRGAARRPASLLMGCAWFFTLQALLAQVAFTPARNGCSMAHCDARINSLDHAVGPVGPTAAVLSHDSLPAGKGIGLGCSSNLTIAACSYEDPAGNNLVIYNNAGTRLWASGSLLNSDAFASAPMINSTGDVIAADDEHVLRVTSAGSVVWDTATSGGIPISPVITESQTIVLATKGGPVSAYDSVTGALIGSMFFRPSVGATNYFETSNTPCVDGNRIYISTQLSTDPSTGALLAVDVDAGNLGNPFTLAWQFSFGGPSGASPACVGSKIYFDGSSLIPDGPLAPSIFGIEDLGTSPQVLWTQSVPAQVPAALTPDPRGPAIWCIFLNDPVMELRSTKTGNTVLSLNIATLVGDPLPNNPYSEINIAGGSANPVMLLGTTSATQSFFFVPANGKKQPPGSANFSSYVIAINLLTDALLWKVNLTPTLGTDSAASQFAIITGANGRPEVVFAGNTSGAYFVGAP